MRSSIKLPLLKYERIDGPIAIAPISARGRGLRLAVTRPKPCPRFATLWPQQNPAIRRENRLIAEIRRFCTLDEAGTNLLRNSINEMGLSARAHDKILRVARTIADLDGAAEIKPEHLNEAVNYRMLDRKLWS